MIEWRIYYSDRSTFDNIKGVWEIAPGLGVICVVTLDFTRVWGRHVIHKFEYYYKVPGREVMGSDDRALIQIHVPGILYTQIKRGGNAWREDWNEILTAATHDPDFPTGSPRRRSTDWRQG